MAQFDDIVGEFMQKVDDMGLSDNTIFVVTTDNGAETMTWPDGGVTPFSEQKGTVREGGFRVPCIARWPAHIKPGTVENGIFSGLDWFPTFVAAAGYQGDIVADLLKGKTLGDRTYKVHLDGYDQTDLLTSKGPSQRHDIWYFGEAKLGALRHDDWKYVLYTQPDGLLGGKITLDWPRIYNLRLDPFESAYNTVQVGDNLMSMVAPNIWRFVFMQQEVSKLGGDLHRVPADAEVRFLQHFGHQGEDLGSHQIRYEQLRRMTLTMGGPKRPPISCG